jgi:hypothetical protein
MPKTVGSWHDMPDKTIDDFVDAVQKLRTKMIPCDGAGDSAVEVLVIDRRKYESFHYMPVEYTHAIDKLPEGKREAAEVEKERWLSCNLNIAAQAMDTWLKIKHHRYFSRLKGAEKAAKK